MQFSDSKVPVPGATSNLHLEALFVEFLKTAFGFSLQRETLNSMAGLSWIFKAMLRDKNECKLLLLA
ncbi:hypothetical protein B9G79_07215 [Bdellovibrio bacteriovorus]|uniref:Uncharacterized protein n=1 Tax=Bdellovibrio bacteriovorus TaxID=959 RepID=A0A1Z3N7E6_BDEBC|nr:hypothetical protein B9G79_07215 [Bdellovibrio bacteriovorus]